MDSLLHAVKDYPEYEIIFIDDGSTDNTLEKIKALSRQHDEVFFISFSRNFGHQNALRAGLNYCTGDAVITMDGDLQHPPKLVPLMVQKWTEGYDVVYTTRRDLPKGYDIKANTSRWYYRIFNKLTELDLKPGTADFRLLDRKVVETLQRFNERAIFYRGLIKWMGFKQFAVPYQPDSRVSGKSKYTIRKMLRLAVDGITGFSLFPLRVASIVGVILALMSFCYVFYAVYCKLYTNKVISGWASVIAGIYFLGGIQLIFLGLFGEYIGKILIEVKNRPHYIVSERHLPENDRSASRETPGGDDAAGP